MQQQSDKSGEQQIKKPLIELVRRDAPDKVLAYCCGNCGIVQSQQAAERCCLPRMCECGVELKSKTAWLQCDQCRNKTQLAKQKAIRDNATEVTGPYGGPVYWDEYDEFYQDVEDCIEAIQDYVELDGIDPAVQTIWCCTEANLGLDADDIINSALEAGEHHEDAEVSRAGYEQLNSFLTLWNQHHGKQVTTWWPDHSRRIVHPLP